MVLPAGFGPGPAAAAEDRIGDGEPAEDAEGGVRPKVLQPAVNLEALVPAEGAEPGLQVGAAKGEMAGLVARYARVDAAEPGTRQPAAQGIEGEQCLAFEDNVEGGDHRLGRAVPGQGLVIGGL